MSMTFQKVRLHKTKKGNGLVLTYEKQEGDETFDVIETHKAIIHKDLQAALDVLAIHLAVSCNYVKARQVKDIASGERELAEKFHINGYSIGGDDENPGIMILGHHTCPDGLAVILNSPFRKIDVAPESRYTFMDDLVARVEVIESEINQYLDGSKRGESTQGTLDLKDEPKATENGEHPEAKKRNRKKELA